MADKITAVAKCRKGTPGDMTQVGFQADYGDERNKAWAPFTPTLSVSMGVKNEVAEKFVQGGRYMITFELAED